MESDLRRELLEIASSLRAYLEVQADSGAMGIPRGARKSVKGATTASPNVDAKAAASTGAHAKADARAATDAHADAYAGVNANADANVHVNASASAGADADANAGADADANADADAAAHVSANVGAGANVGASLGAIVHTRESALLRLATMREEVAACTKCGLAATRTNTVFSRGNAEARVLFLGEAPGEDEDQQGIPFVGRAGQLLDRMIAAMGLHAEHDVYVCNILKCRPPSNRRPAPEEMQACFPYVHEQIDLVKPEVIVALGNTAVSALLGTTMGITKLRGGWKLYRGRIPVMPTYHPSYLLRPSPQQTEAKKQAWEDLKAVLAKLSLPIPKR